MAIVQMVDEAVERRTASVELDPVTHWRAELDQYTQVMQKFGVMDATEVMVELSSMHARMSEIRLACVRDDGRRTTGFRTKEVDPFLEALEFQFKVWSRMQSIRQTEWEISRGQG